MSEQTNFQKLSNTLKDGYDNVAETITSTKETFNDTISKFSTDVDDVSAPYLQSNTVVAKFAFLLLIIILFVLFLKIGIWLLNFILSPSESPYVIQGLVNGGEKIIVSSDPKDANSVPIFRSNNENTGLEFTWSTWLFIDAVPQNDEKYHHIFSKGNDEFDSTTGLATVSNGPGLYLTNTTNGDVKSAKLHVVMDSVQANDPNVSMEIDNIPIKNWVHVAIRMKNTIMDVYVNGTISGRVVLDHVPKQNYHPVILSGSSHTMSGKISDLRYFNRAIDVFDINSILSNGPNLTTSSQSQESNRSSNYFTYLSNTWYTSKL
jgi:hypothetical protein